MVKIFAHRGYHGNNIAQNSIESLDEAFKNNFHGIEFDIHFMQRQLIITHDPVSQGEMNNFSNFADFLKYQNQLLYWLDFKNLQHLNQEDLNLALQNTKNAIENANCDLSQFYFAPYITDFTIAEKIYSKIRETFSQDAKIMAVCDNLDLKEYQNFHQKLSKNNIKYLSIKHNLINPELIDILSDIELFAWTVNDLDRAKKLIDLGIKNFTSDTIIPKKIQE